MDTEILESFAEELGADSDAIIDRWQGRPDLIIDDIFCVEDIDTGKVRDLNLFDVQREMVHAYFYSDEGTLNAYKGRRIGYSFVVVVCFLLESLFYPNSYYPVVSRSLKQAKDRISDISDLIDNAKINIPVETDNKEYIELWNGSAFEAYSSDSSTSRGRDSARAVLMDEMAFMENQQEAYRAFNAFLSLGENRKMVQISTPNTKNDLFMQTFRRGSPNGESGVVSIKQPTFANAEEIDIHTPLHEQDLEPVRPELNIDQIEGERMGDPEGFGQEYLCRPVSDEYRFFDEQSIYRATDRARQNDYLTGLSAPKEGRRIMGVDIGISQDDTAISVTDHKGDKREQKALIVASDEMLGNIGIKNPDRGNANHIAQLIANIYHQMDVDIVVMDSGGVGQTFELIIERKLGRAIVGFDFSALEDVADMMSDLNAALRNNNVILSPNERLEDELSSIVKEKRSSSANPRFSGKDYSESGKDDTAMATALSMFPPSEAGERVTRPASKPREAQTAVQSPSIKQKKDSGEYNPSHGATKVSRSTRTRKNKYRTSRPR